MKKHVRSLVKVIEEHKISALENPLMLGCEVGVWRGDTSLSLLNHFPNLTMTMVDAWKRLENPGGKSNNPAMSEYSQEDMDGFLLDSTRIPIHRRLVIAGTSQIASQFIKDGLFDFVFLDALHTYSSTKMDIECWYPKVRKGGIVAGHDYGNNCDRRLDNYGVKRSVDEFAEGYGHTVAVENGAVWWFQKDR